MRRIGFKLLAFGIGFMTGVGGPLLMLDTKEPPPVSSQQSAVSSQPAKGYDFFSAPEITATWTPDPVPVLKETYCHDPKILPIWRAIRRDKESREMLNEPAETPDCADMFEIKTIDLNHNGKSEILVRGWGGQLCGATGNCRFWVLERMGRSYSVLLDYGDNGDLSKMGEQVRRERTNGYSDLLLKGHFSAAETNFTYFKFDGRKYAESRCLYQVPDYCDYQGGDQLLKLHFISCKSFTGNSNKIEN